MDWSGVNPDIFGTIFQGIVDETRRDENGMDYTSVPNILKVINPLFMDELHEEFDKAFDDQNRLFKLWSRISKIKVFDPACGSGNFLIISYKKLRELEHDIIRRIVELKHGVMSVKLNSQIKLDHFFGIEIEDFPRELAVLSMYIAAHQMNVEFEKEFGKKISIIPLVDMPTIFRENSARVDWNAICPNNGSDEIYVIGNPPYKGARWQTAEQKNDMEHVLGHLRGVGNLDYITIWFKKGSDYIRSRNSKLAFVSTNSICQGQSVSLFWPDVLNDDEEIGFAYESFKWSNNAKNQAGVTVTVISIRNKSNDPKIFFTSIDSQKVQNINAYLLPIRDIFIDQSTKPISSLPELNYGSFALDDGVFTISLDERDELIKLDNRCEKFLRPFIGSAELLRGISRYAIWITSNDVEEANSIPVIKEKIDHVRDWRNKSTRTNTKKLASIPWRFAEIRYEEKPCVIIPIVSSERRDYIPMGYLSNSTIVSNAAFAVYDAEPYLFALLNSKMHMAWIRTVCGKLKTDYRYSSTLGYNTFPCPPLTSQQKEKLNQSARNILFARANHPELTLADMYDPNKMPEDLRQAHEENDILVDKLYRSTPFQTDEARLATLFKLYEEMTGRE